MLWLLISFRTPGPSRAPLEWLGAASLYGALSMLFLNLVLKAQAGGNRIALVAFGFLLALFASGICVTLYQASRSLRGAPKDEAGATH